MFKKLFGKWLKSRVSHASYQESLNKPLSHDDETVSPEWLRELVDQVLLKGDILGAIDKAEGLHHFTPADKMQWNLLLSQAFWARKDRMTAVHFAIRARASLPLNTVGLTATLVRHFIALGRTDEAMELAMEHSFAQSALVSALDEADYVKLSEAFRRLCQSENMKSMHGQMLLLTYWKAHLAEYVALLEHRAPVLIEIGTTREEVSGQGSTRQFAEFCQAHGLDFITVDMDPHNSRMARLMFEKLGCDFRAITQKGEHYLRDYDGIIDFVFLDAYDFDHGRHSELRQSRYELFLGGRIDELQCHRMHLECVQILSGKLAPGGVSTHT